MFSFLFPNMKIRSTKKELMDFEDCDTEKLIKTVAQFRLLNMLFSSSNSLINKYIFTDIKKRKISEVNFLDIGAGGCDIPIWFLKKCKKIGIKASITCIDSDERITEYAIKVCKNFPDIKVIHGNAFDLKLHGKFDYIFTNHFLHHIDDQSIPSLLSIISES
ncbi:MAG TPA: hypothetical protein DC057_04780 [Spirochaetia bacterium]|nr:hypothetical protein [Spirochaetia bacterium]